MTSIASLTRPGRESLENPTDSETDLVIAEPESESDSEVVDAYDVNSYGKTLGTSSVFLFRDFVVVDEDYNIERRRKETIDSIFKIEENFTEKKDE